jgi:mRNA-degrading endonuclease RelE of RelBE toxin-antitoxin system
MFVGLPLLGVKKPVHRRSSCVGALPITLDVAARLNITYSAYRELEGIPQSPLRHIGEAIIALADDPHPPGSSLLQGIGGCYYLAIDDYYILYHLDEEDALTVLGVLQGPYHPLH